jgi:hypothetical protein
MSVSGEKIIDIICKELTRRDILLTDSNILWLLRKLPDIGDLTNGNMEKTLTD